METVAIESYPIICRVCLTASGELRNMLDWNLLDDFNKFADLQITKSDEAQKYICLSCEYNLMKCMAFRLQCQRSDILIQQSLKNASQQNAEQHNTPKEPQDIIISYELSNNKLTFNVTAEDMTAKIYFPCPRNNCSEKFLKSKHLLGHLIKRHEVSPSLHVDLKFFCSVPNCQYNADSNSKHFKGRKFLNQHIIKVHKTQIYFCGKCSFNTASESHLNRHLNTCKTRFVCSVCNAVFVSNEALMVHLKRKHPEEHRRYKAEKKDKKSGLNEGGKEEGPSQVKSNKVTCKYEDNKLIYNIVAVGLYDEVYFNCPVANCFESFDTKQKIVKHHTSKHGFPKSNFSVEFRYYCRHEKCEFYLNSNGKYFNDGDSVKHHNNEVHRDDFYCRICHFSFTKRYALETHLKTCKLVNYCQICKKQYENQDIFHEHLQDKHPDLDKLITERPRKRAASETVTSNKKTRTDSFTAEDYDCCVSPKRSFATQTLDLEETIRNDVALTPWNPKTDEISTQTVFEDLLSLKSQNSEEDSLFFSETVSLSDIQTQTFPIEFGLSRSDKETVTSETQSPDLSIKETQTCFCLYESPKLNLRQFESVSSSPCSSTNLTSAQTQTMELNSLRSDVMLGFNSAETQTSFEEELGKETM